MKSVVSLIFAAAIAVAAPSVASAQQNLPAGTPEQRAAMQAVSWLDGEWRGTAVMTTRAGTQTLRHTERIGTVLGGSVRVIEGHSYNPDGTTAFNAFAILSWDDEKKAYTMRSYAQGGVVDVPFEGDADGFRWSMTVPGGEIRYVTTLENGTWHEVGEFFMEGRPPFRIIEMHLTRVGDSAWPAAGAVPPGE